MNGIKNWMALGTILIGLSACGGGIQKDATEEKIDVLLSKMTLKEKVGQMNQLNGMGTSEDMVEAVRNGEVGSILNELDVAAINQLQHVAMEESCLGIPLLIGRDVIHGFKTIFPIPLGQAASWNPQIAETGARTAALEATSLGVRWTFAPMIDISRDPRWGRIAESCGEDPYLTSVMGQAMIRGFQGDSLSSATSMAACAKHFVAYGASESGKDYNTTWIPELQLREVYLPPFKAAADAGVASFMCSFNDINGVPSSGNPFLNQQILRKEWKYKGVLVSDWESIGQMIQHGYCIDLKDAGAKAASLGVDMDMMSHAYANHLEALVQEGVVDEKQIDESVRNILRLKIRLGLFENPYVEDMGDSAIYLPASLQAAKEAAIEGSVLLKNKQQTLPITSSVKTIAVVGPMADAPAEQVGTWSMDAEPEHCITPLVAIQQAYGEQYHILSEPGLTYSRDKNEARIARAVSVAQQADVILFFAGEEAVLSGEARCRADINLPGKQTEMLKALKQTGKTVVLIVMAGRPLTIPQETEMADAVIYAFHGGTMAGPALADLLFGKDVPSGKLPVTLPRMVGQIPIYYAHKNTGRPASNITLIDSIEVGAKQSSLGFTSYHLDAGDSPLFPFGYGLSYSTFEYSDFHLSSSSIRKGETLKASCKITNTGNYDAKEVVQLYIRDKVGSLVRPVKELKGFKKIDIKAGETVDVEFTITTDDLAYWNNDMKKEAENGDFSVWIAPDSQSGDAIDFRLKD